MICAFSGLLSVFPCYVSRQYEVETVFPDVKRRRSLYTDKNTMLFLHISVYMQKEQSQECIARSLPAVQKTICRANGTFEGQDRVRLRSAKRVWSSHVRHRHYCTAPPLHDGRSSSE